MDIDRLLEGISFDNEEQKKSVKTAVEQELQSIADNPQNTVDSLEKLVLSAFRQIIPFFHAILDFHAFDYFSDLKDSFDDIVNCQQEHAKRPFPKIEHYITLCDLLSYALDSSYLEDCPKKYHKKMKQCCTAFYKELKRKDKKTQVIADSYNYPIFEHYFYFLQYWDNDCFGNHAEEDRECAVNCCKNFIPDILFDILWDLDDDLNHTVNESYVRQAMKHIFA